MPLGLIVILSSLLSGQQPSEVKVVWESLDPLPAARGDDTQPGLAGPFAGVHNEVVIVAGGANFPDGVP